MKRNRSIVVGWRSWVLALSIISCGLPTPGHCQTSGVALLVQQTPAEGGIVAPSTGVHYFARNSEIALVAISKPGYRFVCWLGDVSDPNANHTVTYLDRPKIIIAVFTRIPDEFLCAGGSGESFGGGGLSRAQESTPPRPPPFPPPKPPPIVEPSTILLLALGAVVLRRRRRSF